VSGANTKFFLLLLHRLVEPLRVLFGLVAIPSSVVLSVAFTVAPAALSLAILAALISLAASVLSLSPAAILFVAIATLAFVVTLAVAPSESGKTVVRIFLVVGVAWHFGLTQGCPVTAAVFLASGLAVAGLLAIAKSAGARTFSIFAASRRLSSGVGAGKSAAGRECRLWGTKNDVVCKMLVKLSYHPFVMSIPPVLDVLLLVCMRLGLCPVLKLPMGEASPLLLGRETLDFASLVLLSF
jgi:hypothetical protein